MSYVMLALTAALTVAAYRGWRRFFDGWFAGREEIAALYEDAPRDDLFMLIDLFPRSVRRVLHPIAIWSIALLPGALHFLFVGLAVIGPVHSDVDLPFAYPVTLVLWLLFLGLPAMASASNRTAVRLRAGV